MVEESTNDSMPCCSDMSTPSLSESVSSSVYTPIKNALSVTSLQYSQCSFVSLAEEFVNSLNWHKSFFDESYDRCYCASSYSIHCNDIISTRSAAYALPRDWICLDLRIHLIHADKHDIWTKWIVTFHGTTKATPRSILTHRYFYLPGDKLIDGTTLNTRDKHIRDKKFIFTSSTHYC